MSIIIDSHGCGYNLYVYGKLADELKEVIRRGTAFGTQTSPEMKRFADTLLGRISYTSQGSQLQPVDEATTASQN